MSKKQTRKQTNKQTKWRVGGEDACYCFPASTGRSIHRRGQPFTHSHVHTRKRTHTDLSRQWSRLFGMQHSNNSKYGCQATFSQPFFQLSPFPTRLPGFPVRTRTDARGLLKGFISQRKEVNTVFLPSTCIVFFIGTLLASPRTLTSWQSSRTAGW